MQSKNCSSALAVALALALTGSTTVVASTGASAPGSDATMLESASHIMSLESEFATADLIAGLLSCSSNCHQHNHNHNHNGSHNHNNNNNNNGNNDDKKEKVARGTASPSAEEFVV